MHWIVKCHIYSSAQIYLRSSYEKLIREYWRGKYHCTVDLLFDWFGISCMKTDNFYFYLQNRLIQTSQTGGQQYSDTSPFSIPWINSNLNTNSLTKIPITLGTAKKFYSIGPWLTFWQVAVLVDTLEFDFLVVGHLC